MFYKVVYTYKEEGEGSSMYKHAIIPRREWWEKKVFGSWSRLLDDNFNFYFKVLPRGPSEPYGLQAGPTRKLWRSFWLEEWLDQPGALETEIAVSHQNDHHRSSWQLLSIIKTIIVNHQNDHHQVNDYLTGLSYQINLDLGNCSISTIEVQCSCCLLVSDPYWQPGNRGHG